MNRTYKKQHNKNTFVVWLTGLSGSGKTSIAELLKIELEKQGKSVLLIDGDVVRNTIHQHLGFSREDIKENNRLVIEMVKEKISNTDFILVPVISPFREDRSSARASFARQFVEIYVNCPIDLCAKRDTKGLYAKALSGEIKNLIGVSKNNPYESPLDPELEIKTDKLSLEQSVDKILVYLKDN